MPAPALLVSVTERIFFVESDMAKKLQIRGNQRGIVKALKKWLEAVQRYDAKTLAAPAGSRRKSQPIILDDTLGAYTAAADSLVTRMNALLLKLS